MAPPLSHSLPPSLLSSSLSSSRFADTDLSSAMVELRFGFANIDRRHSLPPSLFSSSLSSSRFIDIVVDIDMDTVVDTDMRGRTDLPPLQLAVAMTKWSKRENVGRGEEEEERRIVECFVVVALFKSALLFLVATLFGREEDEGE
uniref:Uncharacterized protein n=1 Tax=Nelumbo nucifera TaxID=4432 RepID=A0A822ZHI4_NELNU|nr:TPA_asm: hypothetical protein HUJ06_001099 [Nelumbo nucifera]